MESGSLQTNGKLAWAKEAARLQAEGETVGKGFVTFVQNFSAWRCRACDLLLVDLGNRS